MNKIFRYIRYLGVVESYDTAKQKSIILMNEVLFITVLFQLGFVIIGTIQDGIGSAGALISITAILLSVLFYFLNAKHYTDFTKATMCITFPIGIAFLSMTLSSSVNINFFFLLSVILVLLLYRKRTPRIIFIAMNIIGYLMVLYYKSFFGTTLIQGDNHFYRNVLYTIYVHSVTIFVITRFSTVGEAIQTQLNNILKKVSANNEKLQANQAKIEEQNFELERANQELEKFAYIASHDLKSPLRNITSFMNLIQRKLKDYPDESIHEYLDFATSSAKQMHFLVNDILEYSKLGDKQIDLQDVDLNETVSRVLQSLQAIIEEKNAIIEIANLPIIHANETQMTLLFQNLIENGIKYNKSEQPKVTVSSSEVNGKYLIKVKDNGVGIAEEFQEKVFEMFQRLHSQGETQGSGIGLAICMKIAQQHHGKLWLESEEGLGSEFFIELPKADANA